jgi:integrase
MAFIYQRGDSSKWWVGWTANGRQWQRTTGLTNKADAEKIKAKYTLLEQTAKAGELTEQVIESFLMKPGPKVLLSDALKDWLLECEATTSAGTLARYKGVAEGFSEFVGVVKGEGPYLRNIQGDRIREYLATKRAKVSAATANLERRILKGFFLRAVRNGLLKENPMEAVKFFKAAATERGTRRALTLQELDLIFRKAPNLFWRYMIMGGFYTGLRLGDLVTMRFGAIDFQEGFLRLTTGKTNRAIQIPMAAQFRSLLQQALAISTKEGKKLRLIDHLWPDEAARYERHGAKEFSKEFYEDILVPAGLVPGRDHKGSKKKGRAAKRDTSQISFHCLRHTFVSFLKITGSNSAVAKELVGHSSDAVNQLYTHMPSEMISAAVSRLPIAFPDPNQPGLPGIQP